MPKTVVIDELHLTLRVPADLSEEAAEAVRQTLAGTAFVAALRRAVVAVVRSFPELTPVRVSLTR